ncbi:unnamed protein product [Moneuplotes crassus]|uniref:DNA/RNA-binding protein Alba-like domain-containing protein n=2 Tax=Euplotes crassus TaxID=5936 RepID=A0AAD1Y5L3_EUPCR|nr:unnamed protein product [Moneuplotes crassus]
MENSENPYDIVTLKAAGRAMENLVPLVEILKRRIKGLHQLNSINPITEQKPDGSERQYLIFKVILSKEKLEDDGIGYQEPIPEDQVKEYWEPEFDDRDSYRPRGFTRGRGYYNGGYRHYHNPYSEEYYGDYDNHYQRDQEYPPIGYNEEGDTEEGYTEEENQSYNEEGNYDTYKKPSVIRGYRGTRRPVLH